MKKSLKDNTHVVALAVAVDGEIQQADILEIDSIQFVSFRFVCLSLFSFLRHKLTKKL